MYDTLIIGAGMSGLAAGIRLAYYGQRVCILERHYTIGGLNSFYRLSGRNHDVGLHAVTNYAPKGARRGPLPSLLRQLRLRWEEFALRPQTGSQIVFPGVRLQFNNDVALLESEIRDRFPDQVDRFRRLKEQVAGYDELDQATYNRSARQVVGEVLSDPLLMDMIFCPLVWYGNAREDDMDFGQFSVMFRSIFLEGFARPLAGVRLILKKLVRQFRHFGGELRLRSGVRLIQREGDTAAGVVLDSGEELPARQILSSAGFVETLKLCPEAPRPSADDTGRLSFVETISVLNRPPKELGYDRTITFFNDSQRLTWRRPDEACDLRGGVVCSPNNFLYEDDGDLSEGIIRVTALANFDRWAALSDEDYRGAKGHWYGRIQEAAARFVPDFRPHVVATDMFTPRTIQHFTGHVNGAVYGAPRKRLDGATHLKNLWLCGTDQGFVGIIGAITSGISMANRCLLATRSADVPQRPLPATS